MGFEENFLEWPAVRGAGSGGPLDRHAAMPSDANWVLDQATGRKVCLRANGNKIEKTIYGHALIDGAPATFVFRSTAYPIGRSQADLSLLKVKIDDEESALSAPSGASPRGSKATILDVGSCPKST